MAEGAAIVGEPARRSSRRPLRGSKRSWTRASLNTISPAIAQGRAVAEAIDAFLRGRPPESRAAPPPVIKRGAA